MTSTAKSISLSPAVSQSSELDRTLIWLRRVLTQSWQFTTPSLDPSGWWLSKSTLATMLCIATLATTLLSQALVPIVLAAIILLVVAVPFLNRVLSSPLAHAGKLLSFVGTLVIFAVGLKAHLSGQTVQNGIIWPSSFVVTALGMAFLSWLVTVETYFDSENSALRQKFDLLRTRQSNLKVGDQILIKMGEVIPRDGILIKGMSSVDESPLTGVKRPVFKSKGDSIFAASINRDSEILVEVTQTAENDVIEKLFRLREESLRTKPAVAQHLHSYQAAIIILIAALFAGKLAYLTWIQPLPFFQAILQASPLLFLAPLTLVWLYRFLFDLIFLQAFGHRLIIKKACDLEKLAKVGCIFFNKTGTLTKGEFVYSQAFIEHGTNMGEFLSAIFSLESLSDHPLAYAVETHPWYPEIAKVPVRDFQNHAGLGVCGHIRFAGRWNECFVAVGNLRFLKRHRFHISRDMKFKVDELEEIGDTVILVAFDRQVRGIMSFSDLLRKDIRKVLNHLQKLGLETSLITGDTEKTVTHVIGKLGIKKVYSRCTPEEKAAKIEKERENALTVAMVARDLDNQSAFEKADLSISFDTGMAFLHHPSNILILGRDIKQLSWLFQKVIVAARLTKSHVIVHGGFFAVTALLGTFSLLPIAAAIVISTGFAVGICPFVKKYLMNEAL